MNDQQLLRYSRHILQDEIGIEGQASWLSSHALIIGAGGLGSPAALYLAAAGVGHLSIVDHDQVDLSNLQRQILHTTAHIGLDKALSAQRALQAINPDIRIDALIEKVDAARLDELVRSADVVLDCSDNFATRQAVNRACVRHHVPLVSGAALRFDGQITVFDQRRSATTSAITSEVTSETTSKTTSGAASESPCYACVFPPEASVTEAQCASLGVFAPLVGIIGTIQAAEGQ